MSRRSAEATPAFLWLLRRRLRPVPPGAGLSLVLDRTGLFLVGAGAWAAAIPGGRGQRGWRTHPRGGDRSGVILVHPLPVRLEFPILSGESAPPVWRQPNVDHVGSWRATAPGRTVAACVQRALLDSHPVSAKRPEDGGSVHTIVRVGASSRCCCRTARR